MGILTLFQTKMQTEWSWPLMIDVLPLQLKEDDTPAYLINAKDPGKYIDGNITSFHVLFTLPSWNGHEDDKYCV